MDRLPLDDTRHLTDRDWVPFPGGELEGTRPRALCPECREAVDADPSTLAYFDLPAGGYLLFYGAVEPKKNVLRILDPQLYVVR